MTFKYSQCLSQCKNRVCSKIFCRERSCARAEVEVSRILTKYGNIFDCDKIEKLVSTNENIKGNNLIVDLYFYLIDLVGGKKKKFKPAQSFTLQKTKVLQPKNLNSQKRNDFKVTPWQELEHSYCTIIKEDLTQTELYLMVGVLHLILYKFQTFQDLTLALVAIRLFCSIADTAEVDIMYIGSLLSVFQFVHSSLSGPLTRMKENDSYHCKESVSCIFQSSLTKSDFLKSLRIISRILNDFDSVDVNSNYKLKIFCDIYSVLFGINQTTKFVSYEEFYLKELSNRINLKEETKILKTKRASILNYKHILPISIKAEFLKTTNTDIQKTNLQDSFFRALFEGMTEPYLFITIRREFIYLDTLKILKNVSEADLKKQLKINFLNEDGVDSGGIRKEYFQLLSHEITHDESIFIFKNERVWLKTNVELSKLKLIGKIIGVALYNDVVLNIPFASLIFKKILNHKIDFNDLIEIEPEYYYSITNLETVDNETLLDLEMYFVAEYECDDKMHTVPLVLNGDKIRVDKGNFAYYKKLFGKFYTSTLILNEFTELLDGFYSVIDSNSIEKFDPKELEKIVVGIEDFDFLEIKKATIYQGYSIDAKVIRDFWNIVENYTIDNKKKLLRFVTGNDRIPIGGVECLKFTIMKNGCDTERLPSSQTCFNTLLLPEYVGYKKLQNKLLTAIDMTTGFYLM